MPNRSGAEFRSVASGGDQQIRPPVDRRFEHHFVAGIPQLRPSRENEFSLAWPSLSRHRQRYALLARSVQLQSGVRALDKPLRIPLLTARLAGASLHCGSGPSVLCAAPERVACLKVARETQAVSRPVESCHQDSEAGLWGQLNEPPMPMPSESHQVSEWDRQETDAWRVQQYPN